MHEKVKSCLLGIEFMTLFILIPLWLFFTGTRFGIYSALGAIGLYVVVILWRRKNCSFHQIWHGKGWSKAEKNHALGRFLFLSLALTYAAYVLLPDRFMRLPVDNFPRWCFIMVLYPVLSVIPQELIFRSFYFTRYGSFMAHKGLAIISNGILFGFSHIVLNNWIAPAFCLVGGTILAYSYQQHRSLKWSVIEHSLYGCWIFTVGLGTYFFAGHWRG